MISYAYLESPISNLGLENLMAGLTRIPGIRITPDDPELDFTGSWNLDV
jgi:hypothetical protein